MQQWEYMCLQAPHSSHRDERVGGEKAERIPQIEAIMNGLGGQGWELVAGGHASSLTGSKGPLLFFKRPTP